jgi:hypothetical protein
VRIWDLLKGLAKVGWTFWGKQIKHPQYNTELRQAFLGSGLLGTRNLFLIPKVCYMWRTESPWAAVLSAALTSVFTCAMNFLF